MPGKLQIETFTVPNSRFISDVTHECIAGPGAWSYNPDGGYGVWFRLTNGGTRAEWRRWHTSHPVTYRIHVHWGSLS